NKALVLFRYSQITGHAFFQVNYKTHHNRQCRAAINTQRRALVIDLTGMAGSAGKPNVPLAFVTLFHKTYGQAIGVKKRRLLRQVAVFIDEAICAKRLVKFSLFQGDKKVVGNQRRTLGGIVKPEAIVRAPALIQIHGRRVVFTKGAVLYGDSAAIRVVVPFLIQLAKGESNKHKEDK